MRVVVDTGPLYAAADADDADHARCVEVLSARRSALVIPATVVAEASYLVGTRMGPAGEAECLRGLGSFEGEAPLPDEWVRIADLAHRYASFPLGGTDASVVALAERLKARTVVTLDRRHFAAVRPRHCKAFEILP